MHDGRLAAPVFGEFDASGRVLFHETDEIGGRVVLVRATIVPEEHDWVDFVQAYSADAGANSKGQLDRGRRAPLNAARRPPCGWAGSSPRSEDIPSLPITCLTTGSPASCGSSCCATRPSRPA